jgi:hypothetical protein
VPSANDLSPDAPAEGRLRKACRVIVSFLLGCLVGIVFHYILYRMSLPVEPFIYVSF